MIERIPTGRSLAKSRGTWRASPSVATALSISALPATNGIQPAVPVKNSTNGPAANPPAEAMP